MIESDDAWEELWGRQDDADGQIPCLPSGGQNRKPYKPWKVDDPFVEGVVQSIGWQHQGPVLAPSPPPFCLGHCEHL